MNARRTALSLAISAALLAPLSVYAASCNMTNVFYTPGSTFRVPCVQVGEQVMSAAFKLVQTAPEHVWELQQAVPVTGNPGGARAKFSMEDGRLSIPLAQLTDGSLWQGEVQYTGRASAEGRPLFKLMKAPKLNAHKELSKLRLRFNAMPALLQATAVVLKVDHIEITGTDGDPMSLDVSGEVDLLKVIAGEPQLLGEVVLPANTHIGQLRLILAEGSYVVADGEQYPLKVPSGEQTGLKIHGDWGVSGGQITELQLDFSAEDIRFNKGQGYSIRPTVKVAGVVTAALPVDENGGIDLSGEGEPFVLTVGDDATGLRFELPAGAYSKPEDLFGDIVGNSLISPIYELGTSGVQFTKNGTITIHYDEANIPDGYTENDIVILQNGLNIPSLVDTSANTVSAQTNHFSCYTATPVHNCVFSDVDYSSQSNLSWATNSITQLCRSAVIQGYPLGDGSWKYAPFQEANLLEVLKVLLSTTLANCERYNTSDDIERIINQARNVLNITISDDNLYKPVTRRQAISYLSGVHYGYFQDDAVKTMTQIGVTNGERLEENITRAELAQLAYNSRTLLHSEHIIDSSTTSGVIFDHFLHEGQLVIYTNLNILALLDQQDIGEQTQNVVDILSNGESIWDSVKDKLIKKEAALSKDNKGRTFLRFKSKEFSSSLLHGSIQLVRSTGDIESLRFIPTPTPRTPTVTVKGKVWECVYNPDYTGDFFSFEPMTMWEELQDAKISATIKGIEKTDWSKSDGSFRLVWSSKRDNVCESSTTVTATHPTTHKYVTRTAYFWCDWSIWNTADSVYPSFANGIPDCGE